MLKFKSSDSFQTTYDLTFIIVIFSLSFCWFHYLYYNVSTDIQVHASAIRNILDGIQTFPANFLYFFTVSAVSGFNTSNLKFASILTLSIALLFKFLITKKIIDEILPSFNKKILLINLIAFCLLLVGSLPSIFFISSKYLYVGTYPANVWHNSTTIFVMPFVLLLFWQSYKQIREYKFTRLFNILFLIILNILIKPSFIFVFIIAYPILLFLKYKFSKSFWINIIPLVFAFVFIIIEYIIIYKTGSVSNENEIAIKPFYIIQHWLKSKNWLYIIVVFVLSLITSYLFPLTYLYRNPKESKDLIIRYVLFCGVIAIIIFHSLCETGIREFHGNFAWQVFICTYLVFLVFTSKLFSQLINNDWNFKKFRYEIIAFSLHLFFGILYIIKIAVSKSYF